MEREEETAPIAHRESEEAVPDEALEDAQDDAEIERQIDETM